MKIILKSLAICNFKGISTLEINFSETETSIFGANGSGKTSIADAYRWLLTGKDSEDRKDFEVKPVDKAGKSTSKTENQVEGKFEVDGRKITLARVNREKWVTKRGSKDEEFQGNETKFFYNDVPLNQKEYQAKVAELFEEPQMKLLTDPSFFNLGLKWNERRTILTEMAGNVTNEMVLESFSKKASDTQVNFIRELLNDGKDFELRKRELANKRKLAKDEKELIPSRIDEVKRSTPESLDFDIIRKEIATTQQSLKSIDLQISDRNKAHEASSGDIEQKRNNLFELQSNLSDIEGKHRAAYNYEVQNVNSASTTIESQITEAKSEINLLDSQKSRTEQQIQFSKVSIDKSNQLIESKTAQKADLLDKWKQKNALQLKIEEGDCNCPTCKQPLPAGDFETKVQKMLESFSIEKAARLQDIVEDASIITAQIESEKKAVEDLENSQKENTERLFGIEKQLITLKESLSGLETKLANIKNKPSEKVPDVAQRLVNDSEHLSLLNETTKLKAEIDNFKPADISDLIAQKEAIQLQLNGLSNSLSKEDQIERATARREELIKQEQTLAQQIADYESEEFAIAAFIKAKMQFVENRVNEMFTMVKWRMFRDQINGGEEPCCDCLVDGVEYEKNLNTAKRANAGIDIINALSKHYDCYAPIFLDNRESVSDIIPTESQLINLVVSPKDVVLRFQDVKEFAEALA